MLKWDFLLGAEVFVPNICFADSFADDEESVTSTCSWELISPELIDDNAEDSVSESDWEIVSVDGESF